MDIILIILPVYAIIYGIMFLKDKGDIFRSKKVLQPKKHTDV